MSYIGEQLIAAVRELADDYPGYVYEKPLIDTGVGEALNMCLYVHNGFPSCIIGRAMWKVGLISQLLEDFEGANATAFKPNGPLTEQVPALNTLEGVEWEWLRTVQVYQDEGLAWAGAVRKADQAQADNLKAAKMKVSI